MFACGLIRSLWPISVKLKLENLWINVKGFLKFSWGKKWSLTKLSIFTFYLESKTKFWWNSISIQYHKLVSWFLCPAVIYVLKANYKNTRARCEICSKLTIKTPEQRQWCRSGVFVVNFEHISQLLLVFLLVTLNM